MNDSSDKLVVCRVRLQPNQRATGQTQHFVNDAPVDEPTELRIVQLNGDPGFYLIHYDETGNELTDTYHETKEEAIEQARFEFNIKEADWT